MILLFILSSYNVLVSQEQEHDFPEIRCQFNNSKEEFILNFPEIKLDKKIMDALGSDTNIKKFSKTSIPLSIPIKEENTTFQYQFIFESYDGEATEKFNYSDGTSYNNPESIPNLMLYVESSKTNNGVLDETTTRRLRVAPFNSRRPKENSFELKYFICTIFWLDLFD